MKYIACRLHHKPHTTATGTAATTSTVSTACYKLDDRAAPKHRMKMMRMVMVTF